MSAPVQAPMPPNLDLDSGFVVRLTAIDPSTGATVSGVTIGTFAMMVENRGAGGGANLEYGPFLLVPGPNA